MIRGSEIAGDTGHAASVIAAATFPYLYDELLQALVHDGIEEVNQRTGAMIKMAPGGTSFKIDLRDGKLPVTGSRKLYPHVAAAEIAWFLQGTKDVTWMNKHAPKVWSKFVEADGVTVESAYGYRWRNHFERDQLVDAIEALRANPSDRRVWVQAWDPNADGLGRPSKNVPCPVGFTFSVVDGLLHSSLFIRSSDVFVGLPYDVMGHAMLMGVVAASLRLHGLGTMHVTLAHPHLYQAHWDMAEACLVQTHFPQGPDIYYWGLERVLDDPDAFVWAYRVAARDVKWPSYAPLPEVIV